MSSANSAYILLVEDERETAEVFLMILEAEGYRVLHAADGVEALRTLDTARGAPALILTDLMMPRMSGYELCRRIAANPGLSRVPVIVISSVADQDQLPHTDGIKVAFPKPPTIEQLLRCVETWGAAARRCGNPGRAMNF